MRILQIVDGDRWTGPAAVVFDQTAALIEGGVEAQYGFVGGGLLAQRLFPLGWARPLLSKPASPFGYARQVRDLRETVRRERFEIVHAHRSYDHIAASLAVRGTPARLVRTLHHIRHARPDPLLAAVFRSTRAFAFSNAAIAARFGSPGPTLPPVVDAGRFHPGERSRALRERLGLPEGMLLVGTVGKVSAGRGHAEAIRAAAPLKGVALVHVGHGEAMAPLKQQAAALGAADRNFWLGYQEEILPELYRLCDAFLFPASGSDQGQRAILEAMASGLPVVAVELPGVRDLMSDGVEGVIAPDAASLGGALGRLLESAEQRARFARAARDRALEFTGEAFARRAIGFYERVLSPQGSS
ncbi:MAG TPA: glycosyltransferase [Thermoanaerobaculia bacterium]|nr:glycosyltransferase [Thermoanaerobaculia bacterium]